MKVKKILYILKCRVVHRVFRQNRIMNLFNYLENLVLLYIIMIIIFKGVWENENFSNKLW